MRFRRTCLQGFTLLELLVVVAIIGVLAALVSPAVVGALEFANTVECANNLKNVGLGVRFYADAHDGRFPPSSCPSVGEARESWWLNALQPYAGTTLLYRCPSDPAPGEDFLDWDNLPDDDWLRYRWSSYCTNGRMDKAACYVTQVRHASQTVHICEAHPSVRGSDHVHPELWLSTQDVRNVVDHERHDGKSNYLFVDGHVETLRLDETWLPGEVNLWNPLSAPDWCTPMEY
jgi:prepilin-type N-terminal cleavage/methylation domain-containing protein/prepilin-type processing-associated H-X9-DG protein